MNAKEEVIDWLRDAYAMERGLEVTLQQITANQNHPSEVRYLVEQHLEETRQHAQTVEWLLKTLGADTSAVRTGLGMMTEAVKGLSTGIARDEIIKDLLGCYAMEHFEIACYRAIIAAAEAGGLSDVTDGCEQIIFDEEQMAETISDSLPRLVRNYLTTGNVSKAA